MQHICGDTHLSGEADKRVREGDCRVQPQIIALSLKAGVWSSLQDELHTLTTDLNARCKLQIHILTCINTQATSGWMHEYEYSWSYKAMQMCYPLIFLHMAQAIDMPAGVIYPGSSTICAAILLSARKLRAA